MRPIGANQAKWNAFFRRGQLDAPALAEFVSVLRVYCARLIDAARQGI